MIENSIIHLSNGMLLSSIIPRRRIIVKLACACKPALLKQAMKKKTFARDHI